MEEFRRVLVSCGQGRRIERVHVADPGVLRGVTVRRLRQALEGQRLSAPKRHGKWLIAGTDDGPALLLHFGMTGQLLCASREDPHHQHDRVVLTVGGGPDNGEPRELRYRDQRKLQGFWLADTGADVDRILGDQGPDALSVDRARLAEMLAGRRRRVKAVLIDQSVLAGLGNLLGDEILWRARIDPARQASDLTADEQRRLHTTMRQVLRDSVRVGHVPTRRSWLTGRRDDPEPSCPRCSGPLRRDKVAGRSTTWCPNCQSR